MTRITQQQLESYLWGAAVLLRGTIDAGDYKQFIFPLLFFKRLCDVFDEETVTALRESGGDQDFALFPENHRFQVPADAHWREIRKVNRDVGHALQQAMRAIEVANQDKLMGIFGDAQWTNKDRLSDAMLRDLIEHFSTLELTVANLPEDELGQGYEYLIKKFADDSGHTAAEFYTNRTVVHLMTEMLDVQPGESVYDPTCGSGGMLLSCIAHLRSQKKEWRNVKLYGQERNLMTSSIARMNCFLHGIEDFRIERGDTLAEPKLVEGDRLQRFDVVLANPPYSIKQWNREAFAADPWGRNLYGTPPPGRADYAFWQHILQSLKSKSGRCAILFPHGILFRKEEAEMRSKIIEADAIECILGLGANLFYNSPMEACVVICRTDKPKSRKGKILLINAINEVTRERAQSFLTGDHIEHIVQAYDKFADDPGFARVVTREELRANEGNLSIPLYIAAAATGTKQDVKLGGGFVDSMDSWRDSATNVVHPLTQLLPGLATPYRRDKTNPDWAKLPLFDRSKWKRVRFGDVVKQMKEQVDPEADGVERYVAGEHMETENVHIRKWGTVGDGYLGPAFIRGFRKGQVLYGSRRTYLKKVAVAEWDGVTANTTFVIEAVQGKLLQELLPWLMLSERFTKHSVQESKGSTNPYINFPDIAKFEFDLPPLDQQRRIAEILCAVDAVRVRHSSVFTDAQSYKGTLLEWCFSAERSVKIRLGDLCGNKGIRIGPFGSQLHAHEYVDDGIPVVMPANLDADQIVEDEVKRISSKKADELAVHKLEEGDVLLPRRGNLKKLGFVHQGQGGWICGTGTIRIRYDLAVRRRLLFYALSRPSVSAWLERNAVGTTMPNINSTIVGNIEIYWPEDVEEAQRRIVMADDALTAIQDQLATQQSMFQSLINTIFGSTI